MLRLQSNSKRKQSLPNLEKMTSDDLYTFSLNLGIDPQDEPPSSSFILYEKFIKDNIHPFVDDLLYVYEYSPSMKLHIHGTINFTSLQHIILFYFQIRKMDYALEIDTIKDPTIWMNYIFKQQSYHSIYKSMGIDTPTVHFQRQAVL